MRLALAGALCLCLLRPVAADPSIVEDVRAGRWLNLRPAASEPVFRVHLIGDSTNVITRIEILRNGHLWQSIQDVGMQEPPYRGADWATAVDINFDGRKDLRVMAWWGATGNRGYRWWLYNSRTQHFDLCPALDDLSNATPHPDTQVVTTHSVGGMVGQIYDNGTFRWFGPTLVPVHEESQSPEGDHLVKTIRDRRHGHLEVIRMEKVTPEE